MRAKACLVGSGERLGRRAPIVPPPEAVALHAATNVRVACGRLMERL